MSLQAIRKLRALGPGFGVITVGGQRLVSSVPHSLNTDTNAVLELAQVFCLPHCCKVPHCAKGQQDHPNSAGSNCVAWQLPSSNDCSALQPHGHISLQAAGYTSLEALMARAGWAKPRADSALDSLLRQVAVSPRTEHIRVAT